MAVVEVMRKALAGAVLAAGVSLAASCTTTDGGGSASMSTTERTKFEQDRKAILAMTGDYKVTFDFRETVSLTPGYELKKPKLSGADEIIRLVEDKGDFISLQHLLVVSAGGENMVVKHWRQDWRYEPSSVLVFIGGNAWETRKLPAGSTEGEWSQVVYQVEDSPRYGAVGAWTHDHGVSQWNPPAEMRPLPRRDMTTRDDYDAVFAINRHTITPTGWVQEEDNSKLVLRDGAQKTLVREVGVNTYIRSSAFNTKMADDWWNATKPFWALVRDDWNKLEATAPRFGLTMQGEPEPLYMPILELADKIADGSVKTDAAIVEARKTIAQFTTQNIGTLESRIAAGQKAKAP